MEIRNFASIKNAMRVAAASSVVLLTGATAAFAHVNVDTTNDTTGPNSSNYTTFSVSDFKLRTRTNLATLMTNLGLSANTGDNLIDQNTTVDDMGGGDISGDFLFVNEANTMDGLDLDMNGETDIDVDTSNGTTGPSSSNGAEVTINLSDTDTLVNDADIDTNVSLSANSGGNRVRNNTTVDGASLSGDIDLDLTVHNMANTGSATSGISQLGSGLGDVSVSTGNEVTGPNSENYSEVTVNSSRVTSETNTADVDTNVSVSANTGGNTVRNNTTVGGARTGNFSFSGTIVNSANTQ